MMEDDDLNTVSFEDAIRPFEEGGDKKILLTGPRRSGKSSIERVIFHKMSPHETLFLEPTQNMDVRLIASNDFVRFQTWDFGG
mmetsp:Transcript_13730/g.20578  ORF Transcript_13730/g.20578 Transcript_13730/m.20578 type:complete len:83 (-) Transcript_13730:11-259(-)